LISLGYHFNNIENWTFAASFFKNKLWNYWGSVLLALSYICLFARLDAIQSGCLVLSVWLTQTIMTHYWLKYNSMGPVEGVWRKLTITSLSTNR